ncbi:hypothetical protein A9P82_07950 [Arachidicoccus ginsenosidimutans]|uniref:glycoside hydrolase family 16 protein n=1 Tax=Arachidicoccus sp. BS20 TaxID=1850526 RepID=UPI0007F13283|nr:glycoside hydrolase family 16 protein [Arachidicoccus sp. BS20]ANI89229.1 hypothetical protein A9P82_07950 [Arachidicoccus sp. BS20]
MKRINQSILFCLPVFSLLLACGKGGSNYQPPATPTDLSYNAQIVGVTDATPNGDGSGMVNLTLSGKNVTSYVVSLPTESKSFSVNSASGTVNCTFASAPGTTTKYPINISAYCNTVKKDTTIYVTVYCKAATAPGTILLWSDEFDSTALNTNIWNYESGNNNGWGNNELEYYTSDAANVSEKNGYLQITALSSPNYNNSGFNYTSARITTANKYSFQYGKVEIKAKLPGDAGTWPALWLLGNNINTGVAWPACGEIDLMEAGTVWGTDVVGSSLHWGTSSNRQDTNKKLTVSGLNSDFHLYQMDWRADHIAFYVDGVKVDSVANNSNMPFGQNFFFIFNVAIGGSLGSKDNTPGSINLGSSSTMYVDYVRVYN